MVLLWDLLVTETNIVSLDYQDARQDGIRTYILQLSRLHHALREFWGRGALKFYDTGKNTNYGRDYKMGDKNHNLIKNQDALSLTNG